MSDIEILSQMLKPDALVAISQEHGKFLVNLTESKNPKSQATIRSLPQDSLVINLHNFTLAKTLFNGENGECKCADYVIISEETKCILFIELKERKDKEHHIIKQLQGAFCFIKYCQEIGKQFWGKADFLAGYKNRFIGILHTGISISKKRTQFAFPKKCPDSPKSFLKESYSRPLYYNHLACLNK